MKIQLDLRISKSMHTLYNSYFESPPKGVEYKKSEFLMINKKNFNSFRKLYKFIKRILGNSFFGSNQKINDLLRQDKEFDIIHFANHLGSTKKPCVADYENLTSFVGQFCEEKNRKNALNLLSQKNLKYLFPMNKEAEESFKLFFKRENLKIKQEIIYPLASIPKEFTRKIKKENIVLFSGSSNILNQEGIHNKGSYEVILAFEKLSDSFPDWKFVFIGKTPYGMHVSQKSNFIIKEPVPQKELWKIMNKSKIFIQPSYVTPAMAFVEAMHFSLPIITYDSNANKEYIDSKNGILILPEPIPLFNKYKVGIFSSKVINKIRENGEKNSEKIFKVISKLIKNEKAINNLGKESFKRVTSGKFSIKERNIKLLKIYNEILKNSRLNEQLIKPLN